MEENSKNLGVAAAFMFFLSSLFVIISINIDPIAFNQPTTPDCKPFFPWQVALLRLFFCIIFPIVFLPLNLLSRKYKSYLIFMSAAGIIYLPYVMMIIYERLDGYMLISCNMDVKLTKSFPYLMHHIFSVAGLVLIIISCVILICKKFKKV